MMGRVFGRIRREFFPLKNIARKRGILFLAYHSVATGFDHYLYNTEPDSLIKHLKFLSTYLKIISVNDAEDQLRNGVKNSRQVVITFDGGYSSVYENVFPTFKRLGVPFTLFVTTGLISSGHASYCNWSQIREMASHELVTIGSHGLNHLDFESIREADVETEVLQSKEIIESHTGKKVNYLAYPFGKSNRTISACCSGFYNLALISQNEIFRGDLLRVPRVCVNKMHDSLDTFIDLINRSLFISNQ